MTEKWCVIDGTDYVYLTSRKPLSSDHHSMIVDILKVYKIPTHLINVMIVIQKLEDAHKGLVFKGQDSKNRWQYAYGKEHVSDRSESRLEVIKRVHKSWHSLDKNVNLLLAYKLGSSELQIGILLYIMMRLFIRIGKHVHYRATKTQGLITLKPNNIQLLTENGNYYIRLKFIGKDNVPHDQRLLLSKDIYDIFSSHYDWIMKKKAEFFFSYGDKLVPLKEHMIYEFLTEYNIVPKELRTYGANMLFIRAVMRRLHPLLDSSLKVKDYKKLISESINEAAEVIEHTKNVSKKSYLATQLLDYFAFLYTQIFVEHNTVLKSKIKKCNYEHHPFEVIEITERFLLDVSN